MKKYREKNRSLTCFFAANYSAKKLRATPQRMSGMDFLAIENLYILSVNENRVKSNKYE